MTPKIALLIGGTKQRQGGFQPLVSLGRFPANEMNQMDRPPLITDRLPYSMKHTQEYIIYKLTDRYVKSFDADASGVLCIALAVDRQTQFAGEVSPFEVLRKVYDTFCERYMKPVSDGRNSFQNMDIDNEVFRQLLLEYPFEDRISETYVVMNPRGLTGVVCLKEEELKDFFRDTQYAEFAAFKDIEVGTACANQVSPELAHLKVPRPIAYQVYVNDKPTLSTLVDVEKEYTATADSTEFQEYTPVTFCLKDVLSAEGNCLQIDNATVRLDRAKDRVICQLSPKDICYKVVFDWEGTDEQKQKVQKLIVRNEISLTLDDIVELNPHVGAEQPLRLKAKQAKNARVQIDPKEVDSLSLSATTTCNSNERICRIRIQIKELPTTKNVSVVSPRDTRKTYSLNMSGQGMNNSIGLPVSSDHKEDEKETSTSSVPSDSRQTGNKWLFGIIGLLLGIVIGSTGTLLVEYVKKNNNVKNDSLVTTSDSTNSQNDESTTPAETELPPVASDSISLTEDVTTPKPEPFEQTLEEVKQQILRIVKNCEIGDEKSMKEALKKCRKLWENNTGITKEERNTVEAVLNLKQYTDLHTRQKIKNYIKQQHISSWEDIKIMRDSIVKIK